MEEDKTPLDQKGHLSRTQLYVVAAILSVCVIGLSGYLIWDTYQPEFPTTDATPTTDDTSANLESGTNSDIDSDSLTDNSSSETGTISGEITGPPTDTSIAQNPIDLKICAESISDEEDNTCVDAVVTPEAYTQPYSIEVPTGTYYVYSYLLQSPDAKHYYDEMVTCGFLSGCPDTLIPVEVTAGQTVEDINPTDYYSQR